MADGSTIAEQIADIATSKAAIAAAIAAKGVEVPEGTKLAGLAEKVAAIETGGGDAEALANAIACIEADRDTVTEIVIPEGTTKIGDNAFSGCTALTSLTIPDGVTSIGDNAFIACSVLSPLIIPNSVESIGEYAFSGCESLQALIIPEGVKSIGEGAFQRGVTLSSMTIPSSVTSIGDIAFDGCPATCSITFAKTTAEVSAMANYPWGISAGAIIHCTDGDLTVS